MVFHQNYLLLVDHHDISDEPPNQAESSFIKTENDISKHEILTPLNESEQSGYTDEDPTLYHHHDTSPLEEEISTIKEEQTSDHLEEKKEIHEEEEKKEIQQQQEEEHNEKDDEDENLENS